MGSVLSQYANSIFKFYLFKFFSGKPASLQDQTNPDWAPTKNIGHSKFDNSHGVKTVQRYHRYLKRRKQILRGKCNVLSSYWV